MKEEVRKMDGVLREIKELTHGYLKGIYDQNIKLTKEIEELKKQLEICIKTHGQKNSRGD